MLTKTHDLAETTSARTDQALKSAADAFSRAAAQVEELTRRGADRAREASAEVRDQLAKAGDRTVGYIRDEPVKSVVVAAATGAAVALLLGWAMRSRSSRA